MVKKEVQMVCLLAAATVEALAVMSDGPFVEHATIGTLGDSAWRTVSLYVTASVVVRDLNAHVD